MKIHLHLGAHKTGTTFIQKSLAANLDRLNRNGIGFLPLLKQRALYASVKNVSPARFDLGSFLPHYFPKPGERERVGVVMSDENLLGDCRALFSDGGLYPKAREQLAPLRALLAEHEITLFFSVRSYDTFLVSAYCEVLRNNAWYVPFSQFRKRLRPDAYRWPRVVSQMAEALAPAGLVIWQYEDFTRHADVIIRKLAFDLDRPLPPPLGRGAHRPSMSAKAFDVLATVADQHGPEIAAALVRFVDEALPKGELYPAFDPWDEHEKAALRAMYREDCRSLPVPIWDPTIQWASDDPAARPQGSSTGGRGLPLLHKRR